MKPFSDIHEVVRKPILAYLQCGLTGIDHYGRYTQRDLPPFPQGRPLGHCGDPRGAPMIEIVTALLAFLSISVFLAHAFDAYRMS
jgi:hypothetical protein